MYGIMASALSRRADSGDTGMSMKNLTDLAQ